MSEKTWLCTVQELVQATGGRPLSTPHAHFSKVGTDTRESLSGKLFIPLRGEQFDAHDFIPKAIEQGAHVILVHTWREEWKPLLQKATFIQVQDTLRGLQDLAHFWRKKCAFRVLAITGSNGKTSTKEFTKALLKTHTSVSSSVGSFNNHWGVPRSLLEASPSDKVVVLEMGMNHAGELTRLCAIAEPDAVVVTNVGRAHIGELGSQEKVAKAKQEIYLATPQAVHVFNLDNEWTMQMQTQDKCKQITFTSFRTPADVRLRAERVTWNGLEVSGDILGVTGKCSIPIVGRQNVSNLMAASSMAVAAGMRAEEIWRALTTIRNVAWGRNQLVPLTNGARVLFDAYNSNPDSLQALFKNLYEMDLEGKKFLVIGDMRELGAFSATEHEQAGKLAAGIGFSGIWYIGEFASAFERGLKSAKSDVEFHASTSFDAKLAQLFLSRVSAQDLIAVKGSRGMKLEKVVESWPLAAPLGSKP